MEMAGLISKLTFLSTLTGQSMASVSYTATIKRGKAFDTILIPHSNRIQYSACGDYFKIVLIDRILAHGKHPRSGTIAAIKLLEAIRVNTHSIMTIHTFDEEKNEMSDKITLYVDGEDKDRIDTIISKFAFSYIPSNHWNYWLKRWLLSFEDGDDEEIVEKPLFKDTNTIKLKTIEHEFIYLGNPSGKGYDWIASTNNFHITFRLSELKSRNPSYMLSFYINGDGRLGTATASESVSAYMRNIAKVLKTNAEVIGMRSYLQVRGDPQQVFNIINTYIITHPIEVSIVTYVDECHGEGMA